MRYAHERYLISLFTNIQKKYMLKLAYFLRNLETSRENNSRILGIKDAKLLGYCFDMKAHI